MALNKMRIGELIALNNTKNDKDYDLPFYGINREKQFMPTVASTENLDRKKYKIVTKGRFVFSGMQTGRDICIRIGLYDATTDALVSPAYTTFDVVSNMVLPEYLFMIFKSSEMDRYGAFLSDGSIRSNLDWDVFCNIELDLPKPEIQQKYVNIYLGLQENIDALTRGIREMESTYNACMAKLLDEEEGCEIGDFIHETDITNQGLDYGLDEVRGISIEKRFISTKANMNGVSLRPYKVISPKQFCYVTVTSRNGDKVSIAMNDSTSSYIVSSSYVSFEIMADAVIPEYLQMFFKTSEFDRFARFNSWGSARETFSFADLCRFKIPVPKREIQESVVGIYNACENRKRLLEKLIDLQKDICPVLVKGATEEGGR